MYLLHIFLLFLKSLSEFEGLFKYYKFGFNWSLRYLKNINQSVHFPSNFRRKFNNRPHRPQSSTRELVKMI